MAQEHQPSPNLDRPWYYHNWFQFASFVLGWPAVDLPVVGVLWPVWGLLVLRSPWHHHVLLRGLGWAMLAVGGYMFVMMFGDNAGRTIAKLAPGLVVTAIIQVLWTKWRAEHGPSSGPPRAAGGRQRGSASPGPSSGPRRRPRRRRGRTRR